VNPTPRFSVIVPAYNATATLGMTIRSILAQTDPDFELVVVDDGSSDGTVALAREFETDPRVRVVVQENQGTAGARNTGIAQTAAGYVAFLDNDDLWMPGYLEAMGAALDAEERAGFAYCDAWNLDDETLRIARMTELESRPAPRPGATHEEIVTRLVDENFVMSSITARREALVEIGGFDTTIRGTDDYDLSLRILLAGWTTVQAGDAPLLLQRGRHDSQSKNERMMDVNRRIVMRRVLDDERSGESTKRAAAEVVAEIDAWLDEDGQPTMRRRGAELVTRAARLRNRLRADRLYCDEPPEAVAAAFPELRSTSS
jgi:GT2 family glycosyltransferase